MKNSRSVVTVLFLLLFSINSFSQQGQAHDPALIPMPQSIQRDKGYYQLGNKDLIYYTSDPKLFATEIRYLNQKLFTGQSLHKGTAKAAQLHLLADKALPADGYALQIDEQGIQLKASNSTGMFYALQTLQQLLKLGNTSQLPHLHIQDAPTYEWRGVELDVARHFFPKSYLFKFIDLLAFYKLNKFHLHLTDDQGWRLEIKRYPKLVETGAWRSFNNQDSACLAKAKDNPDFALPTEQLRVVDGQQQYGGYYTQEDMREIIAYAAERHIEIIPEIDMPGHMMVATQAYPELTDGASAGWGKQFSVPICPCKPEAFSFVEGVLSEVMELFPSPYIHIGADEVEKSTWEASAKCQELMKKENITDLHALQSYFVNRVNRFIRQNGKTAIGWDEVLEGGADSSLRIMYWRGWVKDAPLKAVQRHHDLIMTPTNPLYFDYLPNKSTLASVYDLRVIGQDIPQELHQYVKGAQANIWTEMIPSTERLEFMILPRLSALAERVWTKQSRFESYEQRLIQHYPIWDSQHLHYRLPDLSGFADQQVLIDGHASVHVENPLPNAAIHYTLDGSLPGLNSPVLDNSLSITDTCTVRFAAITQSGAKSELYAVQFRKDNWKEAAPVPLNTLKPGLRADFYAGSFPNTQAIKGEVVRSEVLSNVHISDTVKWPSFAAKIKGYIKVPKKGLYNFYYTCDDGGVLRIADQLIVDNDGQHAPIEKSGQVALLAGLHPFAIDFIEAGGGFTLKLAYSVDGGKVQPVPDDWFIY